MERRVAFIFVGIVSLLMVAGLVAFVLWANQRHHRGDARVSYAIYFNEAVNGINLGSSVRYLGVEAGQVDSIELDNRSVPPRVRVVVGVNHTVPITTGDVATLKPSGITGVSYLDLRHDQATTAPIPITAEDSLPVIRSESSEFDRLLDSGTSSARHLDKVLERTEKLLSDENLDHFSKTMASLDHATVQLDSMLTTLQHEDFGKNASLMVRDGRQAVDNFSDLSRTLKANPSRIIFPSTSDGVISSHEISVYRPPVNARRV